MRRFYLGVDAGGTFTRYAVADTTKLLAEVKGGSIKRLHVDEVTAMAELDRALHLLETSSGISLADVAATCVGSAGNQLPIVADFLQSAFEERIGGGLQLTGDVDIALDSVFPCAAGIVAIAGTGSNVAGRGADQVVHTAGGWGPVLGDGGSGYQIGLHGLRAALHAVDRGQLSSLLERILAAWSLPSLEALVEAGNKRPAPDFSQLAPIVAECANAGDPAAVQVMLAQADELASQVMLVAEHTGLAGGKVPLAFAGSIATSVPLFRERMLRRLAEHGQYVVCEEPVHPVRGAVFRARTLHAGVYAER